MEALRKRIDGGDPTDRTPEASDRQAARSATQIDRTDRLD
jgi:hypothetical protein